jgi:hypothetical protein
MCGAPLDAEAAAGLAHAGKTRAAGRQVSALLHHLCPRDRGSQVKPNARASDTVGHARLALALQSAHLLA